jgi:hypothetical protein
MEIISKKEEMVFKNEYNGKIFYSIGISKKNQDGKYENGYINVRFKKNVELDNQTKIKIKKAWIDFYCKDRKTFPYIFVSEFEPVEEKKDAFKEFGESIKTESEIGQQIEISEEDLPW